MSFNLIIIQILILFLIHLLLIRCCIIITNFEYHCNFQKYFHYFCSHYYFSSYLPYLNHIQKDLANFGAFVVYWSYFAYVIFANAAKFKPAVSSRFAAHALVYNLVGLLQWLFVKDLSYCLSDYSCYELYYAANCWASC